MGEGAPKGSTKHEEQPGRQQDDPQDQGRDDPGKPEATTDGTEGSELRPGLESRWAESKASAEHGPRLEYMGVPGETVDSSRMAETFRIVIAKPGLDGHDRGAKIVARALRDAGYEVIYTGLHQTPEQIAETAIQEDADAVGLSGHSGAHMTLFPRVVQLLREQGADDVFVFGGGIIPREDIPKLKEKGIEEIFTPGAPTTTIVEWLRTRLSKKAS